jgi:class 3 adenylate cyclase
MAIQRAFLLIADIAGYTRFMNYHRSSLAHAHDMVMQLLEAVIDATHPQLKLSKLEGDAAFFYLTYPVSAEPNLEFVAKQVAAIHQAFHRRLADLTTNNLCVCDGCLQTGQLKIKFVVHLGEAAVHKVRHWTELTGIDVITVHRMLKNQVPVSEYLLMTEPVFRRIRSSLGEQVPSLEMELEGLGKTNAFYIDVGRDISQLPSQRLLPMRTRIWRFLKQEWRAIPYLLRFKTPCTGFRNVDTTPPSQ